MDNTTKSFLGELFNLTGRTALVTGAGRGLGKAMAEALAKAGADVAVTDIDEATAAKTADGIKTLGRKSRSFGIDVTSEKDVIQMVTQTEAELGPINILVNNAGIQIIQTAEEFKLEDWNRVLNVNLTAQFICCREVGKSMIKQGKGGKIINIASAHGLTASFLHPAIAYNSSKAGVVNLTRSLATEWGKYQICVNAIAPGFFKTEMSIKRIVDPNYGPKMIERLPLGDFQTPGEHLSGPVLFLASPAANMVTGSVVVVDGGWLCHS